MSKKVVILNAVLLLSSSLFAGQNSSDFEELMQSHSNFGTNSVFGFEELMPDYNMTPAVTVVDPQATFRNQRISAQRVIDFVNVAYEVYSDGDTLLKSLQEEGWKVNTFQTTTGPANNQVESVGGVVAFKGKNVVISTRGTLTMKDWQTDFRAIPANSYINKAGWCWSAMLAAFGYEAPLEEINTKEVQKTNNYMYGIDSPTAPGFFQSHLSSWDAIKKSILEYASLNGFKSGDLHYTVTGHSLGAAKALINSVNLLSDIDLEVGTARLDASFTDSEEGFDFHVSGRKSEAANRGNVEVITVEAPRAFSGNRVDEIEKMLGKNNVIRIENRGAGGLVKLNADIVPHVAPEFAGYKHVGHVAEIDSENAFFVNRHFMSNITPHAPQAIEKARKEADARRSLDLYQAHEEKLAQIGASEFQPVANPVAKQQSVPSKGWFSSIKSIFGY